MTYSEAVNALRAANANFQFEPKVRVYPPTHADPSLQWGSDLKSEHERYLTHHVGHCPLFVTDYPVTLKPFYARQNSDGETVSVCPNSESPPYTPPVGIRDGPPPTRCGGGCGG